MENPNEQTELPETMEFTNLSKELCACEMEPEKDLECEKDPCPCKDCGCGKEDESDKDCGCGTQYPPDACSNVFYQTDLISVPVKVIPFAKAGPCTTVCCGSPVITSGHTCQGEAHQVCEFTITQKLCVKLPLCFGASIKIDPAKVQCGGISETECDCKHPCVRKCD